MTPFGKLFLPGPTDVHPEVLAAMQRGMISHRGPAMEELFSGLQPGLRALFRTREPVLVAACSATGFMEAAIRSGVERRVLVVVGGAFGDRFARIAEACGKEVIRAVVPEGRTLEAEHLARFLDGPEVDAVALVHSETSTGALAPLEELAAVVRSQGDALLLVDAVSSLGGSPVESELWGLDFTFTGSQKALALPPGLALGVASPRLIEKARALSDRGRYLDLVSWHEAALKHQPLTTPALSLLYALECQLSRIATSGGVEARWSRHYEMLLTVERWVGSHAAVGFLATEGRRSWTVSCLTLPSSIDSATVIAKLAERGWTIAPGHGGLKGRTIRVGHMGDLGVGDLEGLLLELGQMPGMTE